ncbi:7TM-DISM domain-containing protein [Arcicella sp. LKC2W]|uniref:sensor histidine kinase n=1 Tax=Arcicella sp. LKC2W TaxID=2984198 RepID=UPI002B213481|nr:7TM-DISM domain-containing protein [Arcicella sp. LKC2W]MEA5461206.1 7TM-DISM domain-containing protein [Arcicella sp. LKC2W]
MKLILHKAAHFFSLFVVLCCPIHGQSIIIDNKFSGQDINKNVLIYIHNTDGLKIKQIAGAKADDFRRNLNAQDVSYGFHHQQGWCKFKIQNNSNRGKFILSIEQSRADTVQLFVLKTDNNIESMPLLGRHIPIEKRVVFDRNYVYPIQIPKDSSYTYYLYSSRKFGLHGCVLTLRAEMEYANHFAVASNQFGFIFGASIITALMGLVLFWFIRERIYLVYSLYCISTLLVGFSDAGYIHSYIHLPALQPAINIATCISFYLLVGLHIWFTIELLNIKAYKFKWFYYLGKYATWFFISSAFILLFPLPHELMWWLVYISYYVLFFMDAYIVIAIINGVIQKHPSVYFYMVGFFLTLILFTILVLANLNVLDEVNNNVEIFYFTPLVEVIVVVFGLVIRFSNSVREKFIFQKKLYETQQQIITLQEDERTRIARDLHDDVGNSLAALKTKFIYENRTDDTQKTQQIIDDLRDITHNIMPANFQDFTLDKMLETLIKRFQNHSKISFEFILAGKYLKLDSNRELAIYRIVNELISNILKHSSSENVTLQMVYQEESIVLCFEDDGQPFLLENQISMEHKIGVKSMLARLDFIQAKFNTTSDNNGNLLIIDVPYKIYE